MGKKSKKVALISVAVVLGTISVIGLSTVTRAYAEDSAISTGMIGQYPPIVKNLASTFNLDEDKVQKVFVETRQTHRSERLNQHLDTLVENGVITSTEKALIVGKVTETTEKVFSIRSGDLDDDEKHEAIKTLREDVRKWAEEKDIPLKALRPMRHGKRGEPGIINEQHERMGTKDCMDGNHQCSEFKE